jgi:hypothetical protein
MTLGGLSVATTRDADSSRDCITPIATVVSKPLPNKATEVSFFNTFSCRSGRHCLTCRSRTTGRSFRSAIAAYFHLPSADFPCPHGQPWDLDSPTQPLPLPVPAVRLRQPLRPAPNDLLAWCRACDHFNGNVCELAFPSGCCNTRWGQFLATGACPMLLAARRS